MKKPAANLDAFDRKLLNLLQRRGRASYVEMAEAVNLSESACLRRVKALEETGAKDISSASEASSPKKDGAHTTYGDIATDEPIRDRDVIETRAVDPRLSSDLAEDPDRDVIVTKRTL